MSSFGGALPPVVAHLVADISEFSAGMGAAGAEMVALSRRGEGTFRQMAGLGKAAFVGLAAGALIVGGASVHMASQFDASMERIHTQAGASQSEVEALKGKVLDLAGATGQGPDALAEALYHVESVGYRGSAAMSVLNDAAKLATISGANLDDTTYGLTSVMQTFGAKAQDSAKWAAFFNSVVGAGDMRMEAFNRAVGTGYFSAAQTFGVSAQSAGAALAFMTDRGAHADEAATRLRMTLALIAAPSAKAAKLLSAIGLSGPQVKASTEAMTEALKKAHLTTLQLSTDLQKPDGLYVALHHLQDALHKSGLSATAANALLSHAFGGGKSDATILAMLNNLDTLKSKYVAIGKGMGSYNESWRATTQQFSVQVKQLEASVEALGIRLGNFLIPWIQKFVAWLMQAYTWCTKHQQVVKTLAVAVGSVLVVAIAAWIASMVEAAVASVGLWGPMLAIVVAIGLLVAGIYLLVTHWSTVWAWVKRITGEAAQWIAAKWDALKAWTAQKWNDIANTIRRAWNAVAAWLNSAWHTVTDPIVHAWNWVKGVTAAVWGAISGFFKKWWPLLLVIFLPFVAILISLWNHFHETVWRKVLTVWNTISSFLRVLWSVIQYTARSVWNRIEQNVVEPVQRMWQKVTQFVSMLWRSVVQYWSQTSSSTSQWWSRIYDAVVSFCNRMIQPVIRFGTLLIGTLTGALSNAWNALMGWAGNFVSVGSAIVQGIMSGISGMVGSLIGTVQNMASGALSAAKSFLGINSPSRVFAHIVGYAIPEGIAQGVLQRGQVAHDAVTGLSSGLVTTAAGTGLGAVRGAAAGVSGAGAGTINLNLTVEARVDEGVLFSQQQRQALKYQKRNGRPAFVLAGS